MGWIIYNLVFPLVLLVMLPRYLLRMWRRGGYRRGFLQRLGLYDAALRAEIAARPRIWIHAVSVGEMYVALKFIGEWRSRDAGAAFAISTNTSTGHALALRLKHADDALVYFPVDFPPVIRRVLRLIRPRMLFLVEGEIWPNLVRSAKARGIPVAVLNGRLSEKSFAGYRRLRFLFKPVLDRIDRFFVQGADDAGRYLHLGVDPGRVIATGSAKYDVALGAQGDRSKAEGLFAAAGIPSDALVLLGGSTWAGEEEALLDVYTRCKPSHPGLRLVLVPRHAERRDEVMAAIRKRGLSVVQRSRMEEGKTASDAPDVLLVDTTGELRHLYTLAGVIFVGKSLTQHGGQNVIEPASCGKAILVGPHMENFSDVMKDFLADDAMVQVRDAEELGAQAGRLLGDGALRESYGRRAAAVVRKQAGSLRKTVDAAMPMATKARVEDGIVAAS